MGRLTIEPETFCGLKEIDLKTIKIQRKNQQCVTITQSRFANKKITCQTNYSLEGNELKIGV